jgi:signal transduction histidine kinase
LLTLRDRVMQAGGSIEFDSDGGKGSRIVVLVPTRS